MDDKTELTDATVTEADVEEKQPEQRLSRQQLRKIQRESVKKEFSKENSGGMNRSQRRKMMSCSADEAKVNKLEEFYSNNDIWTALNTTNEKYRDVLTQTNQKLVEVVGIDGILEYVPKEDYERATVLSRSIDKEYKDLIDRLDEIKALHSNRTGNAIDVDDFTAAIGIMERYTSWHLLFEGLERTYTMLIEIFTKAINKACEINREHKEKQAAEGGHVIDAVIRTPTPVAINETVETPPQEQ